jgi:hypothetical protein
MSLFRTLTIGFAIAVAPIAGIAWADDSALEQLLVESATTPAQHQALAKYYRSKAADAKAEAETHRSMMKSYSGVRLSAAKAQSEHCNKLASLSDAQAAEYEKLAASHEALAK